MKTSTIIADLGLTLSVSNFSKVNSLRIKSEPLFEEASFIIFFLFSHSRFSGILLQHGVMSRGNKKDSGQARITRCA
jgi:hypothetical protein